MDNQNENKEVFAPIEDNIIDYAKSEVKATEKKIPSSKISEFIRKKWWILLSVAVGIGLILALIITLIQNNGSNVDEVFDNIDISLETDLETTAGITNNYRFEITNQNSIAIYNAKLVIGFDSDFDYRGTTAGVSSISQNSVSFFYDKIDAGSMDFASFDGTSFASISGVSKITYKLEYKPEDKPVRETELEEVEIKVSKPQITSQVNIDKENIEQGSSFEVMLEFKNSSNDSFEDLNIISNYPTGYKLTNSILNLNDGADLISSPTRGNNIWSLGKLEPRKSNTLTLKGFFDESSVGDKEFSFTINYDNEGGENSTILTSSDRINVTTKFLSVSTSLSQVSPIVEAKSDLTILVELSNEGNQSLKNVRLTSSVNNPASVLDYSELEYGDGTPKGDLVGNEIQWLPTKVDSLLELLPGEKISFSYTLKVKEKSLFINSSIDSTQYVLEPVVSASADGVQSVESRSDITYKMAGLLDFTQDLTLLEENQDQGFRIYRVNWNLRTDQNKIDGVNINTRTTLPNAWNISSVTPANLQDNFNFNNATGAIKLELDSIPAYTGLTNPVLKISFDLKVESTNGIYEGIKVLENTNISSTDSFTIQTYRISIPEQIIKAVEED